MKKLMTVVFTMLIAGSLAFAQATGGSSDTAAKEHKGGKTAQTNTSKKVSLTNESKAHKGGKKSKKNPSTPTTPPPK